MDLTVEDTAAGSQIKCPTCNTLLVVPAVSAEPTAGESAASKTFSGASDEQLARKIATVYRQMAAEVGKAIVGQHEVIEQLFIAIFARSHCLLEGVPGLAKTYTIKSLSEAMSLSFRRVQFTPDLMPADITGTDVIQQDAEGRRQLVFLRGPIFAQLVLADEINRSPPKTQAALLEAMQEHSVTIGGQTYGLEQPFFVLATQNPVEQEGTYQLPEAQKDRFMFHIKVNYPNREEEAEIIRRTTGVHNDPIQSVINGDEIIQCQKIVRKVPVPDHVNAYVLDLVRQEHAFRHRIDRGLQRQKQTQDPGNKHQMSQRTLRSGAGSPPHRAAQIDHKRQGGETAYLGSEIPGRPDSLLGQALSAMSHRSWCRHQEGKCRI